MSDESELLRQIQETLEPTDQRRYNTLAAKRRAETLTPAEHSELLRLVQLAEELQVRRLIALIELARRQGISLEELMDSLGLQPLPYE